jgi:hypothetical protein
MANKNPCRGAAKLDPQFRYIFPFRADLSLRWFRLETGKKADAILGAG